MAIFLLKTQAVSRSKKGYTNMLDVASYRSEEVFEKESLLQKAFQKKDRCLASGIDLPDKADEELKNRKKLWQAVEKSEKRKNSRLAMEYIIGLPKELELRKNKKAIKELVADLNRKGMICDWSIHKENKNGNKHAHILTTTREVEGKEFKEKNREWTALRFTARLKNVWQGIINNHLQKNKIAPVNQSKKEKDKQTLNLKTKEYYLLKRKTKEFLQTKDGVKLEMDYEKNKYGIYWNKTPEFKRKRIKEKWKKTFEEIAKREYPQAYKSFMAVVQEIHTEGNNKLKEKLREKEEREEKLRLEKLAKEQEKIERKAKKIIEKNFRDRTFFVEKVKEGINLNFKNSSKDEKTSQFLLNNLQKLMYQVAEEKPEYKPEYDKIQGKIKKLTLNQRITR